MPRPATEDVGARLREIDPSVPLVASSGYSSDPVMAEPGEFGFAATLPKPYTLAELAAVVAGLLPAGVSGPEPRDGGASA